MKLHDAYSLLGIEVQPPNSPPASPGPRHPTSQLLLPQPPSTNRPALIRALHRDLFCTESTDEKSRPAAEEELCCSSLSCPTDLSRAAVHSCFCSLRNPSPLPPPPVMQPGCDGDDIRKAFRKQALIW